MIKKFLFQKAAQKIIANMSNEQKEEVVKILQSHPDFLESIRKEIEEEVKSGRDFLEATRYVVEKNQDRLMEIFKEGGFVK
jgi:predicted transcriptional regulator